MQALVNNLDPNEKRYSSMIKSQFNCSLFCSKLPINSINKLQERVLRINDDQQSNFQDVLSKYDEFIIKQRNLQTLNDRVKALMNELSLRTLPFIFVIMYLAFLI